MGFNFPFYYSFSIPLQGFDKHGRRVLILRGSKADPDKFTMTDQFRANLMVNELLMKECDDEQGDLIIFLKYSINPVWHGTGHFYRNVFVRSDFVS